MKKEDGFDSEASELEKLLDSVLPAIFQFIRNGDYGDDGSLPLTIGPLYNGPEDIKSRLSLSRYNYEDGEHDDVSSVLGVLQSILDNSVNTWHPGFMDKLYSSTNPIGVIADLLLSVLNTNSHVFTVSPALTIIEKHIAQMYASKFGFEGKYAGGMTFSGGSWSNITSMHMARSILFPDTKIAGNNQKYGVYTSLHSHYSLEKACVLLGFGKDSLFKVNVDSNGSMDSDHLEAVIEDSIHKGYTPMYVNATAGTTVFGSFDPFKKIAAIAEKYNIWFHIDGSWGGNFCFGRKHKDALDGCWLADSITANPHKMLGVPTTCSFLLVPDRSVFKKANSLDAPYLFHNMIEEEENYDLANGTMGCGRRADSLKFYLSWFYYGEKGFCKRVDDAYDLATYFARKVSDLPNFKLVSDLPLPCLQVCFYFNNSYTQQDKVGKLENTKSTRYIAKKLYGTGKFLIDYAPNPDPQKDEGEFFRVVFNSPKVTTTAVDHLIESIIEIGENSNK